MNDFKNPKKDKFLETIPKASIDLPSDTLAQRCKFNFSYLTDQNGNTGFISWEKDQLNKLLDKLKYWGRESLTHWMQQSIGSGKKKGKVLAIYDNFPSPSNFKHPLHVPHQVRWGRFRIDWDGRLCGFIIPDEYHGKPHPNSGFLFDKNTFYVVFLDKNHEFYKTKD